MSKIKIKSIRDIDPKKMAQAIEADAGMPMPGLREGLQEAKEGRVGRVYTPDQLQAMQRKHQGAYEQRKLQGGYQRIPGGLLSGEAAKALQTLLQRGAPSKAAAINAALIAAASQPSP